MTRLGEALRCCPDADLARYRSWRITWTLAQRVVRADRSAAEIREALLIEATGWSPDGIRHGARPSQAPHGVWAHDPRWAARDPAAYLEAYGRHVRAMQGDVSVDLALAHEIRRDGDSGGDSRGGGANTTTSGARRIVPDVRE